MDVIPPAMLTQWQREPALWIRAKAGTGSALTEKLSHFFPAPNHQTPCATLGLPTSTAPQNSKAGSLKFKT